MNLRYFYLSAAGDRPVNEDAVGFYQPSTPEEWKSRGAVMAIADGVGGHGKGDLASRLAISIALQTFQAAPPETPPADLLHQMFDAANAAVIDTGIEASRASGSSLRMASTLTVTIIRGERAYVGHVGDCRLYHLRGQQITAITTDHSYAGIQVKLRLVDVNQAAAGRGRYSLTRSVGQDSFLRIDSHVLTLQPGDFLVQCTDGLYCCMTERELYSIVTRWPEQSPTELRDLCERRKAEDNFTAQVLQILTVDAPVREAVRPTPAAGSSGDLEVGQLLDDRYEMVERIATSGMATIFKALDRPTGAFVGLKVPHRKFEADPNFFDRFRREQEIGQTLRHPYILRVEPEGDDVRSRPYMVMEFLEGETLGSIMRSVQIIPEHDALRVAGRVCEGLAYLHEHNIIHRDLKPDNIMICNDGSLRIMDFGIAKMSGARRLTFGGFQPAMGTPDFMAPEQVKGKRGDPRTDIYAIGAILYEMMTGDPPFAGSTPLVIMNARLTGDPVAPRKANREITPAAEEIILHAMARDPDDRYQTATEMKHDLEHPADVVVSGRNERLVKPGTERSTGSYFRWWMGPIALGLIYVAVRVARHVHWK